MEEILDLGVKKEINVFGVAMFQLFVCPKALSWHKKWQWGIILSTATHWLFYATSPVCTHPIVMSQNRVLLLVHNENNAKRTKQWHMCL